MKASFIASLGFIAAVAAQGYAESTSCTDSETPSATGAPYPTATSSPAGQPYPIGTGSPSASPSAVSSGTALSYPASSPVYPTSSRSTSTVYECDTSSAAGTPTSPASSEAPTSVAAPTYPTSTYTPAPVVSTATISTCVPTVITSVYTVTPTVAPTVAPTYPAGTAASSGAVYPTTSITPFTGGAAAKQAGGLLMVAGIAAALL